MKKLIIPLLFFIHFTTFAQQWCIPPNGPNLDVESIINYKNKLVVSGDFLNCGGVASKGLATWDGVNWVNIGSTESYNVYNLKIIDNLLYLTPIGASERVIKTWDGITLNTLSNNIFEKYVLAIAKFKGELYVGGRFNRVVRPSPYGGSTYDIARRIAKKQPIKYLEVGSGVYAYIGSAAEVTDLAIYKDELYLVGYFWGDNNHTMKMENIGKWNGIRWDSVGTGFRHLSFDNIQTMEIDTINDFLYVGGQYDFAGGVPAKSVARWDGHQWESLNNPMSGWPFVNTLKFYHKELYVGYSSPGDGTSCDDTLVAKWDGLNWTFITGLNNVVFDMEVFRDTLYIAGGMHKLYDTIPIPYFVGYYAPPPTHCNWLISRIYANTDTLILGDTIHFENNNKYATTWQWDFGDGVTDSVQKPNHVYQNSGIYTASVIVHQENCYDTAYFTVNVLQTAIPKPVEKTKTYVLGDCVPNPTRGTTVINYQIPAETQIAEIWLSDLQGKILEKHRISVYDTTIDLDFSHLTANTYLFTLFADGKVRQSKRMALVK